jgi:hypothetical protein
MYLSEAATQPMSIVDIRSGKIDRLSAQQQAPECLTGEGFSAKIRWGVFCPS